MDSASENQNTETVVQWHLQAGINLPWEQGLFWNLADTFAANAEFDADKAWLELYVKPGVSFAIEPTAGTILFGKLSAVSSYTVDTDAFDTGDTGDTTLEEAYLGVRGGEKNGASWEVSLGARELKLGTGMLIANGGSSGFERGALKLGPRKAWERSVIASLNRNSVSTTAFYIDPNERPATDGDNELAGIDVRYDDARNNYLGATYVHVLSSTTPYPQAPVGGQGAPIILESGRDGLNTANVYARYNRTIDDSKSVFVTAELARQWSDNIDLRAWGGRVQGGIDFKTLRGTPQLSYSYQVFSGDDPDTSTLERFDPLYYEGNPSAWSTGSKSSMTFINSNVNAHTLALRWQLSPRDTLTLRYSHIRAEELRSPIQFGQAARVETVGGAVNVVSGVTNAELSDDVFLEYSRIINRNTYLSAGASISMPGRGIDEAVDSSAPNWTGGYLNIVVNY